MNSAQRMNFSHSSSELPFTTRDTTSQDGWALLGLMLALAILSIVLAALAIPFGVDSREGIDRKPESLGILH